MAVVAAVVGVSGRWWRRRWRRRWRWVWWWLGPTLVRLTYLLLLTHANLFASLA